MRKHIFLFLNGLLACIPISAKVTLPEIIGDNMILQQNSQVNLWGKSTSSSITIKCSWNKRTIKTYVNNNGEWNIKINTLKGNYNPQSITFDDGEKTTINNILIGEVWFASGQSNMEMPLKGFPNCPIKNSNNDLVQPYELNQIHPCEKKKVGERLCFAALENTYKHTGISSHGPEFRSMKINGNQAILSFNYAEDGFNRYQDYEGFEICGSDHKFVLATVKLGKEQGTLIITNDNISIPIAVRYCFKDFQIGNVTNLRSLPLVPFRTDNF